MRAALALLIIPLLAVTSAQGQEHAGYSCASILANADRSQADMVIAATTYFHGQFLGKPCVDVDYEKAFALMQAAGLPVDGFVNILRERAVNGHPRAISALKRLGYKVD